MGAVQGPIYSTSRILGEAYWFGGDLDGKRGETNHGVPASRKALALLRIKNKLFSGDDTAVTTGRVLLLPQLLTPIPGFRRTSGWAEVASSTALRRRSYNEN